MKATLMKILVIAIAVTGMGCYVWNANRKQQDAAKEAPVPAVTLESTPSSDKPFTVTDDEVRAKRNAMMSSSKLGTIMSENDIRKMLENQKREELQHKANALAPSSKSAEVLNFKEVKQAFEGESEIPTEP
jgi:hypothetical protein